MSRLRSCSGEWGRAEQREFCRVARAVARAALGIDLFDSQLVGALALLDGHVVQMGTGEGKTVTGAVAAAGYALQGRSVQLFSVNDYLARRDAEWMSPFYRGFGVGVGWIGEGEGREQRRAAYAADVTYVPVTEAGFDVLRDRFRTEPEDVELFVPDVVIVDEADAVLIDEASTPLVLAGGGTAGVSQREAAQLVRTLVAGVDYEVDADGRNVALTDRGVDGVEAALGEVNLFDAAGHDHLTTINVALHAQALLHRDVDYIVRDGLIQLVNASRGRIARLQRWPDGLHAAVEAKEDLESSTVSEILDSITIQALVGRYRTVCGMSGTALPVAEQLADRYGVRTGEVGPHRPVIREDLPDRAHPDAPSQLRAALEYIVAEHRSGRPLLVGTGSVAESEQVAEELERCGLDAVVLNAKNDADEAAIIARAGEHGRITISTQMAGRGTDIRLGGADGSDAERVIAAGGLCVIGIGRYDSRRLDDQLRGRAGRQGDPGTSVFFTSLDDDLVRRHLPGFSPSLRKAYGSPFTTDMATELVDHAQRLAEGLQHRSHRNTLAFSEVPTEQRHAVLRLRTEVLSAERDDLLLNGEARTAVDALLGRFDRHRIHAAVREISLHHLDQYWIEHLDMLTAAREGIHLRSLARDNPLDEYNRIAYRSFEGFAGRVTDAIAATLAHAAARGTLDPEPLGLRRPSTTWTYMVIEDPFGSPEQRFGNLLLNALRLAGPES
ncbi:accessory Sec system translocase SecA2 [Leifsonia sp. 21MFCrub1.1]|uniref:accessory Sec system translocase SecA2 n=1 Tax=Leifsonia sp. 21MFCrub1.1 TaxID=1798223 RepID=UPI0008927F0A|nr:accessory Sec system translocase SecA2 [Leifsonia sp. 21MFCrub1.1]SEB07224.1 protein translocase subunit secA [Leifsonia sp. 21MFCrub1.1]